MIPRRIPKIDLVTSSDAKNYYYLSFVIGTGILVSIAMFYGALRYQAAVEDQYLSEVANSSHFQVETQLLHQELHFNTLTDLAFDADSLHDEISLGWLRKRALESRFSCLYFVDYDYKSGKQVRRSPAVEDGFCGRADLAAVVKKSKGQSRSARLVTLKDGDRSRQYLTLVNLISKVEKNRNGYMVGFLPVDQITEGGPGAFPVSVSFSVQKGGKIRRGSSQATIKPDTTEIQKVLFSSGDRFLVTYRIKNNGGLTQEFWPWVVLGLGFLITGTVSGLFFSVLSQNTIASKIVKLKTAELEQATNEAVRANETKSRFLANVSHEVRTPLNLILGMADLLGESELTTDQKQYVTSFQRAGHHLLDLINGILDVTRIETGEMVSEPETVSIPDLVSNVSKIVYVDCRRRKLCYSYRIDADVPRHIWADSTILRQILINLIYNSIKFTHQGEIRLQVEYESSASNLVFVVEDTGKGISTEELDRIFDAFHQSSNGDKASGVGLGLSIVKSFVTHLGGEVKVTSRVNEGTSFRISIPIQTESNVSWLAKHEESKELLNGKKAFVYCGIDNKARFFKESLERLMLKTDVESDGGRALEALTSKADIYDYILVDLINKSIGGLELLRKVQLDSENLGKVVALCPMIHRSNDIEELEEIGVKRIIYDPVNVDVLIKSLYSSSWDQSPIGREGLTSLPIYNGRPVHVLIAEDDLDNRELIDHYLRDENISIQFAEDGEVALKKYQKSHQDFDLVITDIQMPKMDGFQLTKRIRKFERENGLSTIPLLVVTADAQRSQVTLLKDLGASDYLTKPISKEDLKAAISRFVAQVAVPASLPDRRITSA